MLNEHISKHHDRVDLKIDIEKLGKAYLDFKYHLGFRTDDKTKFDFCKIKLFLSLLIQGTYFVLFLCSLQDDLISNYYVKCQSDLQDHNEVV